MMFKSMSERIAKIMGQWQNISEKKQEALILFFAGIYLVLLSYHFPWMYGDDMGYIREGAKGFVFPQGFILIPRFVFVYLYKVLFFLFGFNPFYFHVFKAGIGAVTVLMYYKLTTLLVNKRAGMLAATGLLLSSPFIFTTIWIGEPITLALLFQITALYYLLFMKKTRMNSALLFLLVGVGVFAKEINLVLLPLTAIYWWLHKKGMRRMFALMPLSALAGHLLFIPTRPKQLTLSPVGYILGVLDKYYTIIPVLFVLGLFFYKVYTQVKLKKLFEYDKEMFILLWFMISLFIFVFGRNHEERYVVELLPSFFIAGMLSYYRLQKKCKLFSKKIITCIMGVIILYSLMINGYGIVKTEVGWGNVFKSFEAIMTKVDKEYPGSLVVYQSPTVDFFSDFRNMTVLQFGDEVNMSVLNKNKKQYEHVLYVRYPEKIRMFTLPNLNAFNKIFTVKKGRYEFEVYSLK